MKKKIAAFTIAQAEPVFLTIWLRYYSRNFGTDLFVLAHDWQPSAEITRGIPFTEVPVHRRESFNHQWLCETVSSFQRFLLQSYEFVLFAEVDEIVVPDPVKFPGGWGEIIPKLTSGETRECIGFELLHCRDQEPEINLDSPILQQRRWRWFLRVGNGS